MKASFGDIKYSKLEGKEPQSEFTFYIEAETEFEKEIFSNFFGSEDDMISEGSIQYSTDLDGSRGFIVSFPIKQYGMHGIQEL